MALTSADLLLLLTCGVVAGVVGTAGGITSMVSYPALLAVGIPPFAANVANLVGVFTCWPASAAVSGPELAGQGWWLRRGLPVAAVGGAAGTALLLTTPSALFDRLVPVLVAIGSLTLLAQPWLTSRIGRHADAHWASALIVIMLLSVYGGYFGAGSGVMLLATALLLIDSRMPVANAVKNMLVGAAALTSAAILAVTGPVDWLAVVPLACGLFVGSLFGPALARRLPERVIRWTVAILGLGLAIKLGFDAA